MVFKSNGNGGIKLSLANLVAVIVILSGFFWAIHREVLDLNEKIGVVTTNVATLTATVNGFCEEQRVEHNRINVLRDNIRKDLDEARMEIIRLNPETKLGR